MEYERQRQPTPTIALKHMGMCGFALSSQTKGMLHDGNYSTTGQPQSQEVDFRGP